MEFVILTGNMTNISTMHDPDYAAAIASTYNDHIVADWLPKHGCFRGSITLAPQDPLLAAREIDRLADHPAMVQALMGSTPQFHG